MTPYVRHALLCIDQGVLYLLGVRVANSVRYPMIKGQAAGMTEAEFLEASTGGEFALAGAPGSASVPEDNRGD